MYESESDDREDGHWFRLRNRDDESVSDADIESESETPEPGHWFTITR